MNRDNEKEKEGTWEGFPPTHLMISKEEAEAIYYELSRTWLDREKTYHILTPLLYRMSKFISKE